MADPPPQDPTLHSQPTKSILLINGPNLNLLGTREPHLYGSTTLHDVETHLTQLSTSLNLSLQTFQSNHEGAIIDTIHVAAFPKPESGKRKVDFIIINPGGLTHTSVALRDALLGVGMEFLEVHVTNVHAREAWRGKSFLSDRAVGVICGLGVYGYEVAVRFAARRLGVGGGEGAKL